MNDLKNYVAWVLGLYCLIFVVNTVSAASNTDSNTTVTITAPQPTTTQSNTKPATTATVSLTVPTTPTQPVTQSTGTLQGQVTTHTTTATKANPIAPISTSTVNKTVTINDPKDTSASEIKLLQSQVLKLQQQVKQLQADLQKISEERSATDLFRSPDPTKTQTVVKPKSTYRMEKCKVVDANGNGLIKAYKADSGSNLEGDRNAWIWVPMGQCKKINSGDFSGVSQEIMYKIQPSNVQPSATAR